MKNKLSQHNRYIINTFKSLRFRKNDKPNSKNKIESLDSIRGLAALSVVLSHFVGIYFPAMISGNMAPIHTSRDIFIYHSPLSIFFAGSFAVTLFFILSGFVLSLRFMSGNQKSLFPSAVKRYFRLMPVALTSILMAHFILSFGFLNSVDKVGAITGSPSLRGQYYLFEPGLITALHQGIIGVFSSQALVKTSYNPVLWTIYYELLGSLLVFGLAVICKNQPKRWLLYLISTIAFLNTFFVGFIVGLAIADLYSSKIKIFEKISQLSAVYKFILLAFAISIASYPSLGYFTDKGYHWNSINLFPLNVTLT
ncbi:MAG: acyltransferase, partial [Candidatus Saccharibacteria bacterium]|nr:acyltransferase [Candidatus Saccharibacteria bacterium]